MSDEFVGVPRDDWHDLRDRVGRQSSVLMLVLLVVVLLVLTLVENGVLSSALDLFRTVVPVPGG